MITFLCILLFCFAGYGYALSILLLDEMEMQEYLTSQDIRILKIYACLSWLIIALHIFEKWEEYRDRRKSEIIR